MMAEDARSVIAPRVPFIDDRTGLISREWYRWLLNLFTRLNNNDDVNAWLQLAPPELGMDYAAFDAAPIPQASACCDFSAAPMPSMTQSVDWLAPVYALGTIASLNKGVSGSFTAGTKTVTVTDGIITKIV